MAEGRRKQEANYGGNIVTCAIDKTIEWYQVYESRLAINLLEPWEKCLANVMVVGLFTLLFYIFTWVTRLFTSLIA